MVITIWKNDFYLMGLTLRTNVIVIAQHQSPLVSRHPYEPLFTGGQIRRQFQSLYLQTGVQFFTIMDRTFFHLRSQSYHSSSGGILV